MRSIRLLLLPLLALSAPVHAQLQFRKVSRPAGDTLQKALQASMLGQPGAKPFHVRVEVGPSEGPPGDYNAVIEETWISPTQWVRTITAPHLAQKVVADTSGVHILTSGDYFPTWLRNVVTGVFDPVPARLKQTLADAPIEYMVTSNGMRSSACQRGYLLLGSPPDQQENYANACFRASDGALEVAQLPGYSIEFDDYADFNGLHVVRTLSGHGAAPGVRVIAKVTNLATIEGAAPDNFAISPQFASSDPLEAVTLSTEAVLALSGGLPKLNWPRHVHGHGKFTAWVNLDREGRVREAQPLNSDESGIASDMTAQLVGMQWKPCVRNGVAVQAQGALIFSY
jgi:hypothetical protein